jgi:hypothetical protein
MSTTQGSTLRAEREAAGVAAADLAAAPYPSPVDDKRLRWLGMLEDSTKVGPVRAAEYRAALAAARVRGSAAGDGQEVVDLRAQLAELQKRCRLLEAAAARRETAAASMEQPRLRKRLQEALGAASSHPDDLVAAAMALRA